MLRSLCFILQVIKKLTENMVQKSFSLKNHIFPWYWKINDFCNFGFISEKGPWDYLDIFSGIHRQLRTFSESKVRLRFTNTNTISMRFPFKPWSIEKITCCKIWIHVSSLLCRSKSITLCNRLREWLSWPFVNGSFQCQNHFWVPPFRSYTGWYWI